MYGPIIVLDPGEKFDPSRDHVFTIGWDGRTAPPTILVNGDSVAPPLLIDSSKPHRFRFVNIGAAQSFPISIRRDTALVLWRPRAKDGADLPPASRKMRPAVIALNVGETFDAEIDELPRGEYTLAIGQRKRQIVVR